MPRTRSGRLLYISTDRNPFDRPSGSGFCTRKKMWTMPRLGNRYFSDIAPLKGKSEVPYSGFLPTHRTVAGFGFAGDVVTWMQKVLSTYLDVFACTYDTHTGAVLELPGEACQTSGFRYTSDAQFSRDHTPDIKTSRLWRSLLVCSAITTRTSVLLLDFWCRFEMCVMASTPGSNADFGFMSEVVGSCRKLFRTVFASENLRYRAFRSGHRPDVDKISRFCWLCLA